MLPLTTNVTSYTVPPPIVNTAVPGTSVAHVPYDNVAPSVSSAQVDNNARGNNSARPQAAETPAPLPQLASESSLAGLSYASSSAAAALPAQATFIAQLMGQDTSPATQVVLVEYEKMLSLSNVKYKPSDAAKPQAQPSGLFNRILQEEKAPAPTAQQVDSEPAHTLQVAAAYAAPTPEIRAVARPNKTPVAAVDSPPSEGEALEPAAYVAPPPPRAVIAYAATATRIASFEPSAEATAAIA